MILKTYADFLAYAEEIGVMVFLDRFIEGFPSLKAMTRAEQWFTDDPETDPWQWKNRAAAEKRLAFGNILGGHKGFISAKLYPLFYSACRPDGSIEERYKWGYVKKLVLDVYRLFDNSRELDTGEIRRLMNVTKKDGAAAVDGAIAALQRDFYITVSGNRRKVSFDGTEYGWPANTYRLADDWAADWLSEPLLPTDEARAQILEHLGGMCGGIDLKKAEKLLFK